MKLPVETETLEYKKTTGELREACVSIASILNKHGAGVLYFGVRKDGVAIGQDVSEETLRDVSRAIYETIKPQIYPTVNMVELDGKNLIKIEFSGEERPYSCRGRYYVRVADEDREINPSEMKKFFRESTRPEDWEEVKTDVLVNSYDRTSFGDFKDRALKAGRIPSVKGSAASCLKRLGLSDGEFSTRRARFCLGRNQSFL